jgi:hypothetical protein
MFGANLFWQLDIWRQLWNARNAAVQRFIGAAEERNDFVTHLVAEIADDGNLLPGQYPWAVPPNGRRPFADGVWRRTECHGDLGPVSASR